MRSISKGHIVPNGSDTSFCHEIGSDFANLSPQLLWGPLSLEGHKSRQSSEYEVENFRGPGAFEEPRAAKCYKSSGFGLPRALIITLGQGVLETYTIRCCKMRGASRAYTDRRRGAWGASGTYIDRRPRGLYGYVLRDTRRLWTYVDRCLGAWRASRALYR